MLNIKLLPDRGAVASGWSQCCTLREALVEGLACVQVK